ncbi:MAG: DUF1540 domain-containing protein [Cellulosilyticum sp.]|nr:DUF1540 domain-containing protein [Cellulosilyticum sp.]
MMNMSIECTVKNCKFNHNVEPYCTLNCIKVISDNKSESNYSNCGSFEAKDNN